MAVGWGRSVGEVGVGGGRWCWRRKKVRVRVSSLCRTDRKDGRTV